MFEQLAKALPQDGSRLTFEIIRVSADQIRVRSTPDLGACPSNASDEEVMLHAAIACPLTMTGTPSEVSQLLQSRLAEQRALVDEGVASIQALRQKLDAAKANAEKAKPAKAKAAKAPAAATANPATDLPASDSGNTATPSPAAPDTTPAPAAAPSMDNF